MRPEEMRDRLAGVDPARDVATEPPTTPSSRTRMERIMQTDPTPTTAGSSPDNPHKRRLWLAAAAAVLIAVVAGGAVLSGNGGEDTPVASGSPLELSLGASDTMASCLPVTAELLADMPVAFAGTANNVDGETVTLTVDKWYVGGDADTVMLNAQSGMEALIDAFVFKEDGEYLVSATDETVNFCGFSGPATDELRAIYEEAFGD